MTSSFLFFRHLIYQYLLVLFPTHYFPLLSRPSKFGFLGVLRINKQFPVRVLIIINRVVDPDPNPDWIRIQWLCGQGQENEEK
jgi:hypothetical protein